MRGKIFGGFLGVSLAASMLLVGFAFGDSSTPPPRAAPDHASDVSIFYYPWYGTDVKDVYWHHWDQGGNTPPDSIGSNYYPSLGAYSSSDTAIIDTHMREIASAGIKTVVASWWGQGSFEDKNLGPIIDAASHYGLRVAAHVEPYGSRESTLQSDFDYLKSKNVAAIYVYQANHLNPTALATASDTVPPEIPIFLESSDSSSMKSGSFAAWAQTAHADGIYSYNVLDFGPEHIGHFCDAAREHQLLCAPSVGPGFNGTRATPIHAVRNRNDGDTYNAYWNAAIGAHPDVVSITSFNEWHEGTQIEPAIAKKCAAGYCYDSYEGAFGKTGAEASFSYLNETYGFASQALGKEMNISQRLQILQGAFQSGDSKAIPQLKPSWIAPPQ